MIRLKLHTDLSIEISTYNTHKQTETNFSYEKNIYIDKDNIRYMVFGLDELKNLSENDNEIVKNALGYVDTDEFSIDETIIDSSELLLYSF